MLHQWELHSDADIYFCSIFAISRTCTSTHLGRPTIISVINVWLFFYYMCTSLIFDITRTLTLCQRLCDHDSVTRSVAVSLCM